MDAGLMPKWADPDFKVPDIAISYWNMPEGKRTMKDLILYIRADEAGHVSFPACSQYFRRLTPPLLNAPYTIASSPIHTDWKPFFFRLAGS